MLTEERQMVILQLLKKKQTITLKDILEATSASESTIRRDLTELEKQGELVRIHGGATITERKLQESTFFEKSTKNLQEKINIAKTTASLVHNGDCIYLDAGSTIIQMIPFLAGRDIVVVTNGLTHVDTLAEHGITTYLIGGFIKAKTSAVIGHQAAEALDNFRFDKCFLGVNGFHPVHGYTTPDPEEAAIKRTASSLAWETFVLADSFKYNQSRFAKVTDLQNASLITSNLKQTDLNTLRQKTTVKVAEI